MEPSFIPGVIDQMMTVPDAASVAAARWTSLVSGRFVGGSTGTNMWGALRLVAQMVQARERGSVVTLLCDGGERYLDTYYSDELGRRAGASAAAAHGDAEAVRPDRAVLDG